MRVHGTARIAIRAGTALAAVVFGLVGCGRAPRPAPPDMAPTAVVNAVPPGLVHYERTVFPGNVGAGAVGLAVDAAGRVYVAGSTGIRVFDARGRVVRAWSISAPALCVAVGVSGRVYVGLEQRIEVYNHDGGKIRSWGKTGHEEGQMWMITGIAVAEPDVFVADAGNRCIHHFVMNGDFVGDIGRRDPAAGEPGLLVPSPHLDCASGSGGVLFVTDPGRRRVERRTTNGRCLGSWGVSGLAPGRFAGCCNPIHLAWVPGPTPGVATAEKGTRRVQVFSVDGRLTGYIAPDRFSAGTAPLDIAATRDGRLLVLDPDAQNILVFRPTGVVPRGGGPSTGVGKRAENGAP